jgi:hypothetical protein
MSRGQSPGKRAAVPRFVGTVPGTWRERTGPVPPMRDACAATTVELWLDCGGTTFPPPARTT